MADPSFKIWEESKVCRRTDLIFVTVGNDFRSFNRLIQKVDEISTRLSEPILIQRGYSNYIPKHVKSFDFVPFDQVVEYIQTSDLVISHAGIGTIILCQKIGTPLIIIPRRKEFGEHFNNHQTEIVEALKNNPHENLYPLEDETYLEEKIIEVLKKEKKPFIPQSQGRKQLIKTIREFIERS